MKIIELQQAGAGILKNKQHFEILDGLRGIAAIAVVLFHFMEIIYSDYSKNFIGHGFLAVDFFFCLSGFVIAYAYDDRISKMGKAEFFKSRLIRLHPLVVMGAVLGLLAFLFDPFGGHPELYSAGQIILLLLTSIFLVPYPVMGDRYFNLFGLNAPSWSLFWEYVANILYAFVLYKIARRYLVVLTMLAAALLCFVSVQAKSLIGGWDGKSFWDGGARILYSFLAGMLIYRSNWAIKTKIGFAGLAVLLALSFAMPFSAWNWLTEPLIVIFYFPFLIALGAGATLTQRTRNIAALFGKISYPLYMTHYAALWMFGNYYSTHTPGTTALFFIVLISIVFLIAIAWLVMTFFDIPIRKYLTAKRKRV